MSGGCPCGGPIVTSTRHDVTASNASEWAQCPIDAPATVEIKRCAACGRQAVEVWRHGALIARRG